MRSTLLFITLCVVSMLSAQEIRENILDNPTYMQRMIEFEKNPLRKGQIVFLGNSLTQGGKWSEYFPKQNPANRGISGDNTLGMLGRLSEIVRAKPAKLFLMAGINDIALSRDNHKIMNSISVIVYQIQAGSPETKIYIQSLLPINNDTPHFQRIVNKEKQIEKLNKELTKFCEKENITFINLYPSFLYGKRKLNVDLTTDGLHLNERGYALWVEQIRKYIE